MIRDNPFCRAREIALGVVLAGCAGSNETTSSYVCALTADTVTDFSSELACPGDYGILASEPADASIPGATSCHR